MGSCHPHLSTANSTAWPSIAIHASRGISCPALPCMIITIHRSPIMTNFAVWITRLFPGVKARAEKRYASVAIVAKLMMQIAIAALCVLRISCSVYVNAWRWGRERRATYGLLVGGHNMKQRKGRSAITKDMRAWRVHIGTRFTRCHLGLRCSRAASCRDGILTVRMDMMSKAVRSEGVCSGWKSKGWLPRYGWVCGIFG